MVTATTTELINSPGIASDEGLCVGRGAPTSSSDNWQYLTIPELKFAPVTWLLSVHAECLEGSEGCGVVHTTSACCGALDWQCLGRE